MQGFNQTPPCKKTIQQNVAKYCLHGTHLYWNKFGIRRTALSDENAELPSGVNKMSTRNFWELSGKK